MKKIIVSLILVMTGFGFSAMACTNFIFTKGATTDGSVMITYSADSHVL